MFDSFFDATLGQILAWPDPFGLLIVSFIMTALITIAYKYLTDQELMKTLKGDIKALQKEMKQFKDNPSKMMGMQKQAMEKNMKYMMHSFKPTLFTLLPILVIFGWLRSYYTALGNPDVFLGLSWIWSYIIFSIVISIALRKILKIH